MLMLQTLLAQQPPAGGQAPASFMMFMPFIVIGLIIYLLILRPQSAERKKRVQMLSAIKKNDRVVTVGGILGTVLSVKDDEVTLKVDESSNTKITFIKSAIQRVISSGPAAVDAPPTTGART